MRHLDGVVSVHTALGSCKSPIPVAQSTAETPPACPSSSERFLSYIRCISCCSCKSACPMRDAPLKLQTETENKIRRAATQDDPLPPCPTCYTSTVWIAPPCAPPITCTGPSTLPDEGCTRTVDLRPTTITIPGLNPACPTTPRATSNLGCPPRPACFDLFCSTITLGSPPAPGEPVETTITDAPLECIATTTYTIPPPTTRSISFDTTITPPPFPTFPPDEDE